MRVAFTGSREFDNRVAVLVALRAVAKYGADIIVGDARGLDRMVAEEAGRLGLPCRVFRADWEGEGRRAGFLRNARMIAEQPDRVVAFFGRNGETRGTRHTIDLAVKAGIPVVIYRDTTASWETIGHQLGHSAA